MPAGRPRAFDAEKALDAAIAVFWKHGYEGASLETLTGAMGINRPSLYAAFGDKADLFEKAVARYEATRPLAMFAALTSAPDLPAAIDGYFDASVRNIAGRGTPRGCLVACVLADASEAEPRWRALAAGLQASARTAMGGALARFLPPERADRLALLLAMMTGGLAVLARSGASTATLADAKVAASGAAKAFATAA